MSLKTRKDVEVDQRASSGQPDVDAPPELASGESWTQGPALTTKALTVALWAVLACGPLALAANLLQPDPVIPAAAEPAPSAGEVAVVGESAVQAVRVWLSATRENPGAAAEVYPQLQSASLPKVSATVSAASVAELSKEAPGVWSVTVGVDAAWPDETGTAGNPARLYFEVPVATAGNGAAASPVALPAPVPAPEAVVGVQLSYQSGLPANSVLGTSVGEFLTALLAGQGDVGRYITPGAQIAAVTPAPFTAVEVRRVWAADRFDATAVPQDGQRAQVLVDATVTPAEGVDLATQYRLELTARAGRWEISQMQGNPAVRADSDATAPTTEGAQP